MSKFEQYHEMSILWTSIWSQQEIGVFEYYRFRIGNKWHDCPIIDKHNERTELRRPYGVTMECVDNEMYVAFFLCRTPFFRWSHTEGDHLPSLFLLYLWSAPKRLSLFSTHLERSFCSVRPRTIYKLLCLLEMITPYQF